MLVARQDYFRLSAQGFLYLAVSQFGFARLCAFASLRKITFFVQQFSGKGAEPQRKTAK